ncbi:predicted protein [Aspergillus terreus NIH2624]|uniref:Urease accessory protein UreD n=1 Tax=Aspergillus terreus (strain NIH 2624 / FGSC A1156) TaxID=341663 RepID=Q0CVE5_ASPTN|nr:uncharacterized protein ATEG_02339 [Aspergillus terreus NIH2624]EAU37301.1 predicted protein [Aspergillus terreus NIH2624]
MPHKHKRRKNDDSTYDLPPSVIAKPLPARDPNAKSKSKNKKKAQDAKKNDASKAQSRPKSALEDDTPKAFRRLMQLQTQRTQPKSDPEEPKKKRKRDPNETAENSKSRKKKTADVSESTVTAASAPQSMPKILPGEKLSDFAARVDREMPISGMKRSNNPAPSDLPKIREHRVTKHEKHLRRLQEQWRKEEKEIQEREAAEREEREGELEEETQLWKQWQAEAGKAKAKKKGAGKKGLNPDDLDPWAKLNKTRMNKPANPLEVAQAPPQLTKPREIFKVRGGAKVDVANVPAAGGSLRQREELAAERRSIVEQYRKMMAEKRK